MSINNIKNKLKKSSKIDTTWIKEAKYRKDNEEWLDLSFEIAVKIMSALKNNKAAKIKPGSQVELAQAMECTPQYISKVLKGTENLQLETITKLQSLLGIQLIEIPKTATTEASGYTFDMYKDFIKNFEVDLTQITELTSILRDSFKYSTDFNQYLNNYILNNLLDTNLNQYQVQKTKATMKIAYNACTGKTSYNPKDSNSKTAA